MPSLGFLKKKRTKDSQGNIDTNSPSSPTYDKQNNIGSPISPQLSKQSTNNSGRGASDHSQQQQQQPPQSPPPQQQQQQSQHHEQEVGRQSQAHPGPGPTIPTSQNAPPTLVPAPEDPQMNSSSQQQQYQGTNPNQTTQNVPSIQNMINGPSYGGGGGGAGGSQHDSAYSSTSHYQQNNNSNTTPTINAPQARPSSNPLRETKGKYTLTDFTLSRTLGTGSFGRVHLVQSKHNQRFYAIKVLKKAQVVKMKQVEHTNDERRMLQRCKHPFLITLWGTFQDAKNVYMVMDFVEGGELFSLLRKSQVKTYPHNSQFIPSCAPQLTRDVLPSSASPTQ